MTGNRAGIKSDGYTCTAASQLGGTMASTRLNIQYKSHLVFLKQISVGQVRGHSLGPCLFNSYMHMHAYQFISKSTAIY